MPSLQLGRDFYLCDRIKIFVIKKKLTNYFFVLLLVDLVAIKPFLTVNSARDQ